MFNCTCEFEAAKVDDSMNVCTEEALALINPCHLAENGQAADGATWLLPREKSIDD